ncbi:MAG: putative Ig domain-containing protein [Candidatus Thermoplasmatota archaeon]|nr:putative Ig domain-containing protein [Candidatus Thermoplasmatota archaeon]
MALLVTLAFCFMPLSFGTAGSTSEIEVFAGSSTYNIGPLYDTVTVVEDEMFSSSYFAVMGGLTLNSLTTDADWLTTFYSNPLMLNTTSMECRWSFNQGDARDSSGNGHDGTVVGATPQTGVFDMGGAMMFDGDDHISVPHNVSLNITDEITVEAFIFPTFTDSGEHMILSKGGSWGDDDPQDYELTMDRDRPLFQIKVPFSNDWYGAAPADPIEKNVWHHVAGVYDGSRFNIYIDGFNQTTLYNGWDSNYRGSVYAGGLPTSTHNISIGRREPATWGSLYFEGAIDEVRIFDRALSADEILEHATKPATRTITVTGTPDNGDVGYHEVTLNITDEQGNYAERTFPLTVENAPPSILTENVLTVYQDEEYSVEYDADDESLGDTYWQLATNASWLNINRTSGLLNGTPCNDDVGIYHVKVTFNDGNGGTDSTEFDLQVVDVNDQPKITIEGLDDAIEDTLYSILLEAEDPDGEDLIWTWETDALWLTDHEEDLLSGTPANDDVGTWNITFRAEDPRGLYDERSYGFTVMNTNDEPIWMNVPGNITLNEGDLFTFEATAVDVDVGDEVEYSLVSFPEANITINRTTGHIEWMSTRDPFDGAPYLMKIVLRASDGEEEVSYNFEINMTLNVSPQTSLITPANESIVGSNTTTLVWETLDPDSDDPVHYLYISSSRMKVVFMDESLKIAVNGTSYVVTGLEYGTTYYWAVLAWDGFSLGCCINDTYSFYVNTPPTSEMSSPADGARISYKGAVLSWEGADGDQDTLSYDVYLGKDREDVEELKENVHAGLVISGTTLDLEDLDQGTVYYWTVIPTDGHSRGASENGIFSFRTNSMPSIQTVAGRQTEIEKMLTVDIEGSDPDAEDADLLEFSLEDYQEGMVIDPTTGVFTWTPYPNQVGTFTVVVILSDGIDQANVSFNIQVLKPKDEGEDDGKGLSTLVIILIVIVALIVLAAIIAIVFMMRGKGEEEPEEEETPEEGEGTTSDTDLEQSEQTEPQDTEAEPGEASSQKTA